MSLFGSIAALTAVTAIAVVSYETIDTDQVIDNAHVVADAATCHTLTGAAASYYSEHDVIASDIDALIPYVSAQDDVLAQYVLVDGIVSGPGCP